MSAAPPPKRVRLGTWSGIATRYSIYRTDHAIDVDERDTFEVQRRRVFFDDVLLITHHRQFSAGLIAALSFVLLGFWGVAIGFAFASSGTTAATIALIATPFLGLLIAHFVLRTDVITVFGRRTKATLRYHFRKRFARATFEDLVARTRAAQAQLASEIDAQTPAPAEVAMPEMPPDFDAAGNEAPVDASFDAPVSATPPADRSEPAE